VFHHDPLGTLREIKVRFWGEYGRKAET
jgi:hypothetical protein